MSLTRSLGTIRPCADDTMSIWPRLAHASAMQAMRMMVAPIARPAGDGGVSTISRAAGRKASSCALRIWCLCAKSSTILADFMQTCLGAEEPRVASARADQLIVSTVLDDTTMIDSDDAIGLSYSRQPVGDDENGAILGD